MTAFHNLWISFGLLALVALDCLLHIFAAREIAAYHTQIAAYKKKSNLYSMNNRRAIRKASQKVDEPQYNNHKAPTIQIQNKSAHDKSPTCWINISWPWSMNFYDFHVHELNLWLHFHLLNSPNSLLSLNFIIIIFSSCLLLFNDMPRAAEFLHTFPNKDSITLL